MERVVEHDETAEAVAQQEDGPLGLLLADQREEAPQVLAILLPALDVAALAGGTAVPP
jgi:hypothetical protein